VYKRQGDELLEQVKGTAKAQFRKDVAPFYVTVEIGLLDTTDGIPAAEPKDTLKRGIEYADRGRLDAACELWGSARIQAPASPALLFNLGVCAESRGDADAALSLYRQADKLLGKPDDEITAALNRVSAVIKNRKKLEQQLRPQG
jgi:tetratricopeptide (TPR) repeat protein